MCATSAQTHTHAKATKDPVSLVCVMETSPIFVVSKCIKTIMEFNKNLEVKGLMNEHVSHIAVRMLALAARLLCLFHQFVACLYWSSDVSYTFLTFLPFIISHSLSLIWVVFIYLFSNVYFELGLRMPSSWLASLETGNVDKLNSCQRVGTSPSSSSGPSTISTLIPILSFDSLKIHNFYHISTLTSFKYMLYSIG